jgi:hypothetical protein
MPETLTKLLPNHDLQCYFFEPSAIAALSQTSVTGFTVSGCWRQQFDWAVLEWNRDNVFEHPTLRNLPDGNLSGVQLSYQETRTNCIPFDSVWYPTVDWPYLRVWADSNGVDTIHQVPLLQYATALGDYTSATVQFELQGTASAGDYIELAWLDQHYNYQLQAGDTLATAATALASIIAGNQATGNVSATVDGTQIMLTYLGAPGSNGNRVGVYGTVSGAGTESWSPSSALFQGGVSPQSWQVNLNFSNLTDVNGVAVPTTSVRKLRWTWSADMQPGNFVRSEFSVVVIGWTVSGNNLQYQVAGPGSRRIEDDAAEVTYQGTWSQERGNYSGGSIQCTTVPGSSLTCSYTAATAHSLYLGTRRIDGAGPIAVQIDNNPVVTITVALSGEDVLVREPLGQLSGQVHHTIMVTHAGAAGHPVYFDFLEIAIPSSELPVFSPMPTTALATDWDTNHSLALAPERTAWLIHTLGFHGRANHYAGALWFYEICCPGQQYAWATVSFAGTPQFAPGQATEVVVSGTAFQHLNLIGDTAESIATCLALLINAGATGVWAQAEGATLTITARAMGSAGNSISLSADTAGSSQFHAQVSRHALAGGVDGTWLTDLNAILRLNRAARDWSLSYFQAMQGYGIPVVTSFSMELGNGDTTVATGIAQRYPDGTPVWLSTPSLQTNFGPASTAYWQQVYQDMAVIMSQAGIPPYLQFGEVQWWYFADPSGMPFYDAYTTSTFQTTYGRAMGIITSQNADPTAYRDECVFLPGLIGQFTETIMSFVRQCEPNTRFEVLYPPDVNNTPLNQVINFPSAYWTSTSLACLKTENFTYTGDRDLNQIRGAIRLPAQYGFPPSQSSHLVGISDPTTPWARERNLALTSGLESVVLFALDQFCLVGYSLPLAPGARRAQFMGA